MYLSSHRFTELQPEKDFCTTQTLKSQIISQSPVELLIKGSSLDFPKGGHPGCKG